MEIKENRNYHWSSWANLCVPCEEGGIGIRNMNDFSNTLAMKRWWRFRTSNSLWANFVKNKYCIRSHMVGKKLSSGDSHAWKHMLQVREEAEKHMLWQVNSGTSSFWWDNWTGKGPLAHQAPETSKSSKLLVKQFIKQGKWDMEKLKRTLPDCICDIIGDIEIGNQEKDDQIFWDLTETGKYSNRTAWNLVRTKRAPQPLINKVWHSSIPFKMSFLSWRLWKDKLPFEEVLSKFGKQMEVKCYCCTNDCNQTMNHVFSEGVAANKIWNIFGTPLGIRHSHLPIRHVINFWWNEQAQNEVHKLILHITPIVICWSIWKETCACRYGNQKKSSLYKLEQQVGWIIQAATTKTFPGCKLSLPWKNFCHNLLKLQPVPRNIVVSWKKPELGFLKLNTDGSFNRDNGKAGLGGALRDEEGQLIMAFSIPFQCINHNIAEAKATWYGGKWCIQNGYNNLIIESDSMVIIDMLKNNKGGNFRINRIIEETSEMLKQANFKITHCYREANQLADWLAKFAMESRGTSIYLSANELPNGAKGPYLLDKRQVPSIRLKVDKANFFVS